MLSKHPCCLEITLGASVVELIRRANGALRLVPGARSRFLSRTLQIVAYSQRVVFH
jgi:hypothetical protein